MNNYRIFGIYNINKIKNLLNNMDKSHNSYIIFVINFKNFFLLGKNKLMRVKLLLMKMRYNVIELYKKLIILQFN